MCLQENKGEKEMKKIIQIALWVEIPDNTFLPTNLSFIQDDIENQLKCCMHHYELMRIEEFEAYKS